MWPLLEGKFGNFLHLGLNQVVAKGYREVAAIQRFTILTMIWESFWDRRLVAVFGRWPLIGGGCYYIINYCSSRKLVLHTPF